MQQGWLSVIGLAIDALGFIIIAWGWLKQWRWQHEDFWVDETRRRYDNLKPGTGMEAGFMNIYRQIYKRRMRHIFKRNMEDSTWLVTTDLKSLMNVSRDTDRILAVRHIRDSRRTFMTGLALVLAGFSIQGLGNVPGGIPALSIYPNVSMPAPPVVDIAEPDRLPSRHLSLRHRYRRAWPSQTK